MMTVNIRDIKNIHIHVATRQVQCTHPWQMMPHCLNTVRQILIHPAVFGVFAYPGHFYLLYILVIVSEVLPLESHLFEDSLSTLSNRQITPQWKVISPSSEIWILLATASYLQHMLPYDYFHINLNCFPTLSLYFSRQPRTGYSYLTLCMPWTCPCKQAFLRTITTQKTVFHKALYL